MAGPSPNTRDQRSLTPLDTHPDLSNLNTAVLTEAFELSSSAGGENVFTRE